MSIKIDWKFSNINLSLSTFSLSIIEMHWLKHIFNNIRKNLFFSIKTSNEIIVWHDLSLSTTWRLYIFTYDISASNHFGGMDICWGCGNCGILIPTTLGCCVELCNLIVWDGLLHWSYSILNNNFKKLLFIICQFGRFQFSEQQNAGASLI